MQKQTNNLDAFLFDKRVWRNWNEKDAKNFFNSTNKQKKRRRREFDCRIVWSKKDVEKIDDVIDKNAVDCFV